MAYTLQDNLQKWANKYESPEFIKTDPVQIPHRYTLQTDIEISAFVTSWIAWGNRTAIIKKADFIDREIFRGAPYEYITSSEWKKYKDSKESLYRTFTYGDFYDLCARLWEIYINFPTMENAVGSRTKVEEVSPVTALKDLFGDISGIPFVEASACKRLCLFLRWMCRKNSAVDFGLWNICKPENLVIPLDTHVHRAGIELGLISRKHPDWEAATALTDKMAEIFPGDPCKGDFALFGYSIAKKDKNRESEKEPSEPEFIPVADLSIADVIKMPLFVTNIRQEITRLWDMRRAAAKKGKLKSHPIEKLENDGALDPGRFAVLFARVLDKVETSYPATAREFIREVGILAFQKTMQKLINDENARNSNTGDGK